MENIQNAFEKGTVDTIKKILSKNNNLNIDYKHDGADDPYFTHTVSQNGIEIFYLKYAIPGKADKSTLRIKGRTQKWSTEAIKELYEAVDKAWWAQVRARDDAKEKAKTDKIQQEQDEISSFLAGFLPTENERH